MKPKPAIKHYDVFAQDYDKLSNTHGWVSPRVVFRLTYPFVNPGERLLDLGIGTGQSSESFHKAGLEIFGVDGSEEMLRVCREKNTAKNLTLFDFERLGELELPYEARSFNHITSNGVFYFFEDLQPFFEEVIRVLKPNGTFGFTVEDSASGDISGYVNRDNDAICPRMNDKAGVRMYKHSPDYIKSLVLKRNFTLLEQLKFLAYHSPTEERDVFFRAYVLRNSQEDKR